VFLLALTPPGVAIFRHLGVGLRLTERFLLALALAPFALALPALGFALLLRDMPVAQCLFQSEFLWVVIALWPRGARPPAISEPLPGRGEGFPAIAALGTALGVALLVAAVPLAVPYVRMWSDAWFHSAAIVEIGRHGVPPQDPNFAGIPLYYFWFFHFTLALLRGVDGASPFHQQVFLNVWSAAVLALAAAQLAYRAFGRGAAAWAGAVAVLGLNPLGWAWWIGRGMVGESRGLARTLTGVGTISDAEISLSWLFPHNHASMLNRFWTGTALTPAIALGAATAWAVARALERPTAGAWLRCLLLALATLAFHPAYGALALAALAAALVGLAWSGARRAAALGGIGVLAIAALAAVPYVRAASVPGAVTPAAAGFYTPNAWMLLLAIGPWAPVMLPALRSGWERAPGRFALLGAAFAALMAVLVVLPERNSEKLGYLAWVAAAPIAAAGLVGWFERWRLPAIGRLTIATALLVPTAGLYALGASLDRRSPGVLMERETTAARNRPLATPGEAEAYQFLRVATLPDAVVIEAPLPWVNQPVPLLAERRLFCGRLDVYLANHFAADREPGVTLAGLMEEFGVRRDIQHSLFEHGELDEAQRLYLSQFGSTLYLILRRAELRDPVWDGFARRAEWEEVFANREVRIYRYSDSL
jgi:hypothetical protein